LRRLNIPSSTWSTPHRPLHGRCPFATPVGATGVLPPDNPATNVVPSPNFLSSGLCHDTSSRHHARTLAYASSARVQIFDRCSRRSAARQPATQFLLRALNVARADEELPAIVLPTNWFQLKPQEQIFVIVDLERTARGSAVPRAESPSSTLPRSSPRRTRPTPIRPWVWSGS